MVSGNILELWNEWDIRLMVELSLVLQIFLTIFGARRKFTTKIWIRILVWSAYLGADSIATVVLSKLASSQKSNNAASAPPPAGNQGSSSSNALRTFWAPFLLLHLGGPGTITAYSLEDNELWLRHFLGLIIQVWLTFSIFVKSWSNTALTYIAIPIFITGLIKYGERTIVLRSSSSQYLKNLLLSDPDPGPDFIEIGKHIQGKPQPRCSPCLCLGVDKETDSTTQPESLGAGSSHRPNQLDPEKQEQPPPTATALPQRSEASTPSAPPTETFISSLFSGRCWGRGGGVRQVRSAVLQSESSPRDNDLEVAYFLFKRFRYLFADLILSISERMESYSKFENKSAQEAFKLVAVELGYMYDVLYTKVSIIYSPYGILFRFISFCCTASALIAIIFVNMHQYQQVDIYIKYILMISAVVVEIYAFIILLFSDWTRLCLTKLSSGCCHFPDRKRWSESMAQYNLISSCLRNVQPICNGIHNLPWIGELVDKYHYLTRKDVDADLQKIIFEQLREKSDEIKGDHFSIKSCKKLLAHRGDNVLESDKRPEKRYNLLDISRWSINDVDFDHSLLLWHIATDLCYDSDNTDVPKRRISKYLSDYMLYLLVFCPSMLQEGIAEIRYRDTLAECKRFFPEDKIRYWKFVLKRKKSIEKTEACKKLLGVKFGDEQERIKGDKSQSVLFYGCRLAKQLQDLETQDGWNRERKWKMISEVWVKMLTYAANKCRWKEHGQQLRRGGELLTHVRLLMAHLGLSEQYRIQKPFVSEKLDGNIQCSSWLRAPYNILCRLLNILCCPCSQCYQCLRCSWAVSGFVLLVVLLVSLCCRSPCMFLGSCWLYVLGRFSLVSSACCSLFFSGLWLLFLAFPGL
ncbi:hypothetical protein EZV62_003299 [Acer yangbiense]|uniref:DUF4220 domain-containing protein n=1 Tax=Acer yangbiense TaxID=1000413 RepID=A0A5C7IH90_9ROSI|nr:hypothetical protein EZV62_003299 [Acer yangbiense]